MITLADLDALRAAHPGIEYDFESREYVQESDALPDKSDGRRSVLVGVPTLTIALVRDNDTLPALLDRLAGLGASWPIGRVLHVTDGSPIACVWGEIVVLDGAAPWRLKIQVHHNRGASRPVPDVRRFEV